MRVKLIATFLLTFLLFLGALIWRADQILFGDQLGKSEAQSRLQISAVVDALDFEMQNIANILALSFETIEKSSGDYQSGTPYSRFQMLATLNPPAAAGMEWTLGAPHFLDKTEVRSWATNYISLILKSIKPADFQLGSSQVFSINDPKRKPYLLLISRGIRQWYVGLMGVEVFQKLMDRQKGQIQSVLIVNSQGQTLGHTTAEYVGKSLAEDPLVAEIMKSNLASGSGQFTNLKEEKVQGIYEKIPMTNLYVVLSTPLAPVLAQKSQVKMQFIFMGLGLCLVGIALFIFISRGEESNTTPAWVPTPTVPPVVAPAIGVDKNSAYVKLASTLSHELKSPLTSVVGCIQLALSVVSEQKAIEYLHRADRDARAARDIIQKLVVFAGEDKVTPTSGSLETILHKVLKNLEGRMSIKKVQVTKNIQSVPQFTMPVELVSKAIESVIVNAIEAMERAPQKNMTVSLLSEGADVVLSIADSGEGMTEKDIEQACDPFYTTRSGTQHVGLGLSMAKGVMTETKGELFIQSEKGKGTKVIMTFRPQESSLAGAELPPAVVPAAPKPETESVVDVVLDKPALKSIPAADPILVDNSIDKLIDGIEPEEIEMLETKKISEGDEADLPPPPLDNDQGTMAIESPSSSEQKIFSSKIDRPNLDLKKKASKLDEAPIAIRKPGSKA